MTIYTLQSSDRTLAEELVQALTAEYVPLKYQFLVKNPEDTQQVELPAVEIVTTAKVANTTRLSMWHFCQGFIAARLKQQAIPHGAGAGAHSTERAIPHA